MKTKQDIKKAFEEFKTEKRNEIRKDFEISNIIETKNHLHFEIKCMSNCFFNNDFDKLRSMFDNYFSYMSVSRNNKIKVHYVVDK